MEQAEAEPEHEPQLSDRVVEAWTHHADLTALTDGTHELTYAELLAASRRVAAALAEHTPERATVMVMAAKTTWSVAALFGTMLGARTALPLDPDEPPAWWAEHAQRVGATHVLVDDGVALERDLGGFTRLGPADCVRDAPLPEPDAAVPPLIVATSGSTGTPKLISMDSRFAVTWWDEVQARHRQLGLRARGVPVLTPLAAGGTIGTLAGALAVGGCALLLDAGRTSPGALLDLLVERPGPMLDATPALVRAVVGVADARGSVLSDLRQVEVGGGQVDLADLVAWRRVFPEATLVVRYGSTELGAISRVVVEPGDDLTTPPSGVVRDGLRIRILDADGVEVPTGEVGEVWLASDRPVGEYVDDPDLRARTRRTDPDGTVWLRTHDLGRLDAEGRLAIHGRDDERVKVNNAAVDLNVVAGAIRGLPGVADAEVTAVDVGGNARLVAWVVMEPGGRPTVRALRAGLADSLPRAMQPRVFRAVGEIPRTTRGKVDRMALRAAAARELPVGVPYVAPRTPVEEMLAERVVGILGVESVGIRESFFELGGDSLDAHELVDGLVDDLALSPERQAALEQALVTGGCIATLAAVLDGVADAEGPAELRPDGVVRLVLRDDGGPDDPVVVLLTGGGLTPVSLRPLAARLDGCTVWALLPPGFRSGSATAPTIRAVADAFAGAIVAAAPHRDLVVAGFSFGALIAVELARALESRGIAVRLLALLDAMCPPPRPPWPERLRRNWRHLPTAGAARIRRWRGRPAPIPERWRTGVDGAPGPTESLLWAGSLRIGYEPAPLAIPILVVRSTWTAEQGVPADLGWARVCRGPLHTVDVPGTHLDVLREPAVAAIAAALHESVRSASPRP